MEVHLLATRLTVLLFCLLASADAQDAQDAIFTAPSNSPDLTLVLNNNYLVQWTTDWPSIDLWVFCSGSEQGGVGPNGANLLHMDYHMTSFNWKVAKVQTCELTNKFHFMIKQTGEQNGINSASFHVVANEGDLSATSEPASSTPTTVTTSVFVTASASSTSTATTQTSVSATSSISSTEISSSPAALPDDNNNDDTLSMGLGIGLGVGLPLSAIILGIIWYCHRRREHRLPVKGRLESPDTPSGYYHDHHEQSKVAPLQYLADKPANHELDASHVRTQERCELDGSK